MGDRRSRCLITGANGFVARYLGPALVANGMDVVSLSRAGHKLPGTVSLVADLLDPKAVLEAVATAKPDVVVHLAAQSSVASASTGEAAATWSANVTGSLNLALAVSRIVPDASLIFASSGEVYGANFSRGIATEDTSPEPLGNYARSKLVAERAIADALSARNQLIVVRPFNHSGAGQRATFVLPSFAAQIARIEAGLQSEIRVGNLDVERDFLDVRDVVLAYVGLVEQRRKLDRHLVVNVASGRATRLRDVLDLLLALSDLAIDVIVDPARVRPAEVPVAVGSASRLRSILGWEPRFGLHETVQSILSWERRRLLDGPSTQAVFGISGRTDQQNALNR